MLRAKDEAAEPGWGCALIPSDFDSAEADVFRMLAEAIPVCPKLHLCAQADV
jgi:hypothetical protein